MVSPRDIDGGWAWFVLGASYLNILLCSGLAYLAGVFQVVFLEEFQGSVALTSWVTSLFSSLMQLAGPLSSALSNNFSCRVSVMVGGCFIATGLFISGLAKGLGVLVFSFGILAGTGLGLIYTASIVIVSFYFDKRRPLVNGLVLSAGGLGFILAPQLTRILLDNFSWRESLAILAGVAANSCVCGALMFSVHEKVQGKYSKLKLFCQKKCPCFSNIDDSNSNDRYDGISVHSVTYFIDDGNRETDKLKDEQERLQNGFKSKSCDSTSISSDALYQYESTKDHSILNKRTVCESSGGEFCNGSEPLLYELRESNNHQASGRGANLYHCHPSKSDQHLENIHDLVNDAVTLSKSHGVLSTRLVNSKAIQGREVACSDDEIRSNKDNITHEDVINSSHRPTENNGSIAVRTNNQLTKSSKREGNELEINPNENRVNRPTEIDDNIIIINNSQNSLKQPSIYPAPCKTLSVMTTTTKPLSGNSNLVNTQKDYGESDRVQTHAAGPFPKLYKNRRFWVLCTSLLVSNAGCGVFNVHVPSFLKAQGLSEGEVTNVLSMNGLAILCGRCLVGAMANSMPGNDLMFFSIMHVIGGLFMCLMPVLGTSFIPNLLIIFGIGSYAGTVYAVLPTLTIQLVGLERLATAFGIEMVSAGVGYLLSPPLAGLLVDLTGGYEYNILCGGLLFIVAGLMLFVIPGMKSSVLQKR